MNPAGSGPGGAAPPGPQPAPSWWSTWGLFLVVTGIGWLPLPMVTMWGWVVLGGAHGVFWGGNPPLAGLGTLMWAASALLLVGPGCLASSRLWPLKHRLMVAAPVGAAWFALGRFVLPAPGVPGSIRSTTDALAPLLLG